MAEELKHLIEQIQKEGVEKAQQEADAILSQAKEKAAKIVSEAERKAEEIVQKAKKEAEDFAARSIRTLQQAARDLLITVGKGCEKVITETLGRKVDEALDAKILEKLILAVVEGDARNAEISVSPKDREALLDFCVKESKKSGREITLVDDAEILSGFRVRFEGENAYLDYTGEALAEALAAFLRPQLAEIVSSVAREQVQQGA